MCELLHTSAVVQKMQGGLELAINSRVGGRGKLAERIEVEFGPFRPAASRRAEFLLVALPRSGDLFIFAKDLFVEAKHGWLRHANPFLAAARRRAVRAGHSRDHQPKQRLRPDGGRRGRKRCPSPSATAAITSCLTMYPAKSLLHRNSRTVWLSVVARVA